MEIRPNTKIRIRLESFNHELLVSSCRRIIETSNAASLNAIGMVPLPTSKRIYCVLRSPHVDKDSRNILKFEFIIDFLKFIMILSFQLFIC